jgi:hypothetical protein
MPEDDQDQGAIAVAVAPLPRLLHELFDFGRRQVFAGTKFGIWRANWN